MRIFARCGMFTVKKLPAWRTAPLAAAYVAYIVLCNLNLKVNNISFYQVEAARLLASLPTVPHSANAATCRRCLPAGSHAIT